MSKQIIEALDEMRDRRTLDTALESDLIEYFNATVDEHAKLEAALRLAVAALDDVSCACSFAERDSGHLVGCHMPYINQALESIAGVLSNKAGEL